MGEYGARAIARRFDRPEIASNEPRPPERKAAAANAAGSASRARFRFGEIAVDAVRPAAAAAIQRLVLRMGNDKFSVSNAEHLVNIEAGHIDTTGSLRAPSEDVEGPPLAQLKPAEAIHVVAHGDGQGRIEGKNAKQFVTWLVGQGLRRGHTGALRLVSCFSGTVTPQQVVMTEAVAHELRDRGFGNPVIGFDGLVQVRKTAIRVIRPQDAPQFDVLSGALTRLTNDELRLAFHPPPEGQSKEAKDAKTAWKAQLEKLREQSDAKRLEVEALWKPQNKDKNISYVAADPQAALTVNPTGSKRIDEYLDAVMSIRSADFDGGAISDQAKRRALGDAAARLTKGDKQSLAGNKQIERLLKVHLMSFPLVDNLKLFGFA